MPNEAIIGPTRKKSNHFLSQARTRFRPRPAARLPHPPTKCRTKPLSAPPARNQTTSSPRHEPVSAPGRQPACPTHQQNTERSHYCPHPQETKPLPLPGTNPYSAPAGSPLAPPTNKMPNEPNIGLTRKKPNHFLSQARTRFRPRRQSACPRPTKYRTKPLLAEPQETKPLPLPDANPFPATPLPHQLQ
jgi:hypothetical protein